MNNTEDKLSEANYFLERMKEHVMDGEAFRYNLSAFLTAFRSVTFIMRKEYNRISGFEEWYRKKQIEMKKDEKMKLLKEKRNITIHQKPIHLRAHVNVNATSSIGLVPNIIIHHAHANGTEERYSSTEEEEEEHPQTPAKSDVDVQWRWYFDEFPDVDAITICEECLKKMKDIVSECKKKFSTS